MDLCDKLVELAYSGVAGNTELTVTINERHEAALLRACNSLTDAKRYLIKNESLEIVSQQVRLALEAVGEITGKTTTEDLLERIFSTFCIGK